MEVWEFYFSARNSASAFLARSTCSKHFLSLEALAVSLEAPAVSLEAGGFSAPYAVHTRRS
jgi:hypothetical protein